MLIFDEDGQLLMYEPVGSAGRMSQALSLRGSRREKISGLYWRKYAELSAIPFQSLDLTPGAGNLLGEYYWELISPWRGGSSTLNTGASPKDAVESSLSQILEGEPHLRYYLSRTACLGILRRARERGKELPPQLKAALMMQAGLWQARPASIAVGDAYHINQRNEGIDLNGVSGALMHTQNMQMQTFVTQPEKPAIGFDGYNGDLTGEKASTLGTNCGMSTGRNGVIAFAANQRDEVRDLHDKSGALGAQPGMKQQTFIASGVVSKGNGECFLTPDKHTSLSGGGGQAGQGYPCIMTLEMNESGCLTPWDTQQTRIFTPDGVAPTMAGADGGGGRNPVGLLYSAAFNAGAGPGAGGIGYIEEGSPTLKSAESGTNMVPAVLCLNDEGGQRMDLSKGITGTLRSQEKGHQPLVMATQQGGADIGVGICPTITAAAGTSGNNQPVLYEGHGHDLRYKPMEVAPTLSSAAGMGGGNIPLVGNKEPALFENHGIDARYTGPHPVAPTMSARYGTGGNNVPLVEQEEPMTYCIVGNVIDRQPENGGNGKGYQGDLAYTLTATDHHAVFSRQRVDVFRDGQVASCESARQHKDATDLVYQQTVGALTSSDRKGPNSQYVSQDKCIVEDVHLIRRLTPLECERLQGFPDGWTNIAGAADSARYKALGNSVAIPCVEYIMAGIAKAAGGAA